MQSFDANENYYLDLTHIASDTKTVSINIEPINAVTGTVMPRATKTLTLTQATLGVKYNKQSADSIDLTLPEDVDGYFSTTHSVATLQEANIPKIILTLTTPDGKPLDGQ